MTALSCFPSERGYSDIYTVDRSHLETFSSVLEAFSKGWPALGGMRELKNRQIRQATTMQERLEAWHGVCGL